MQNYNKLIYYIEKINECHLKNIKELYSLIFLDAPA